MSPKPVLAVVPQRMRINKRTAAPTYSQERLGVTPQTTKSLSQLNKFSCLWSLSLAYCQNLPTHLFSAISNFAGLGFLDISYTHLSFRTLQQVLRPTRILSLRCTGCPNLATAEGEGGPERRGFAVMSLPEVWILDGIFVTWEERKKWSETTKTGTKTMARFVDLVNREFVPFNRGFTPMLDERKSQIWTPRAKDLLEDMPREFHMGVDEDLWRLKVLARDLESKVMTMLSKQIKNPSIIQWTILSFVTSDAISELKPDDPQDNTRGLASRTILALLLFGSLCPEFPLRLLQRTLESIFLLGWDAEARLASGIDHWSRDPASPLSWKLGLKSNYLALLVGRLTLDSISETSRQDAPPLVSTNKLKLLGEMLTYFIRAYYIHLGRRATLEEDIDPKILTTHIRQWITESQQRKLAALHLDIVQMTCLDDSDSKTFLEDLGSLRKVYCDAVEVLVPEDCEVHEEVYLKEGRSEDERLKSGMGLDAYVVEMKFLLCSGAERVAAFLQNGLADADDFDMDPSTSEDSKEA